MITADRLRDRNNILNPFEPDYGKEQKLHSVYRFFREHVVFDHNYHPPEITRTTVDFHTGIEISEDSTTKRDEDSFLSKNTLKEISERRFYVGNTTDGKYTVIITIDGSQASHKYYVLIKANTVYMGVVNGRMMMSILGRKEGPTHLDAFLAEQLEERKWEYLTDSVPIENITDTDVVKKWGGKGINLNVYEESSFPEIGYPKETFHGDNDLQNVKIWKLPPHPLDLDWKGKAKDER